MEGSICILSCSRSLFKGVVSCNLHFILLKIIKNKIHEEKMKEIATMKEVWISDPNYHKSQ